MNWEFDKLKDVVRTYNDEFDNFRRITYQAGKYQICCLISFHEKNVEYKVNVPDSVLKVDAIAYRKEPLVFSLNNEAFLTVNSKIELEKFKEELEDVLQIYDAIEVLDKKYNTLRDIEGDWTIKKAAEAKAYV